MLLLQLKFSVHNNALIVKSAYHTLKATLGYQKNDLGAGGDFRQATDEVYILARYGYLKGLTTGRYVEKPVKFEGIICLKFHSLCLSIRPCN